MVSPWPHPGLTQHPASLRSAAPALSSAAMLLTRGATCAGRRPRARAISLGERPVARSTRTRSSSSSLSMPASFTARLEPSNHPRRPVGPSNMAQLCADHFAYHRQSPDLSPSGRAFDAQRFGIAWRDVGGSAGVFPLIAHLPAGLGGRGGWELDDPGHVGCLRVEDSSLSCDPRSWQVLAEEAPENIATLAGRLTTNLTTSNNSRLGRVAQDNGTTVRTPANPAVSPPVSFPVSRIRQAAVSLKDSTGRSARRNLLPRS